jgi:serine protease Do
MVKQWGSFPMNRKMFGLSVFILIGVGFFCSEVFCQTKGKAEDVATIQSLSTSLADLALKVQPSVVQIRTIGYGTASSGSAGYVTSQHGTGSGVILDSEGFIVTNAHVVEGAQRIEVWLQETLQKDDPSPGLMQKRSEIAHLVGKDPSTDLAVIKIDRSGLVPLNVANSDLLRQGQIVMAIGNPMALENSVTMGVVSSVERQLSPEDPSVYIQTDAPINPGNSGGPLVDAQGRLAGINTLIFSQSGGSEGIGFAIPANMVQRIYAELRKEGHVHHGHIGIHASAVTPSLAKGLQLPRDWGVILEDVESGGPSDQAGLQSGDYIIAVDGKTIGDLHQMLMAIDRHAIGDIIQIKATRGSETVEAKVIVEIQADDPNRFREMVREKSNLVSRLGVLAANIDETVLKMVPELRKPAGVLVAALVEGMPESEEGLAPGDLIISLNNKTVANVDGLRESLESLKPGSSIVLQIQREDQLRFIVLDLL